jgi:ubiquinone/menaquinone biosynthesis C-methylase UbiE
MGGGRVYRDVQGLRAPERLALLEADRVASICLHDHDVRTVLDIGTGSGVFAEVFSGLGLDVTGIDIQDSMLEVARKLIPRAHFQLGTSENLPFADGSFDLCFLGLVLHESSRPLRALREAHRVSAVRAAVLEWPYREGAMGPPLKHRLKTVDVLRRATAAGFSRIQAISLEHLVLFLLDK